MKWLSKWSDNITNDYLRYIIRTLRQFKKNIIDYYRMQFNYGLVGNFIAIIKTIRYYLLRKSFTAQKSSRPLYNDSKKSLLLNDPIFSTGSYPKVLDHNSIEYPKISIVTSTLNKGKVIERCILSILDQKYPNLEYIIIDRGSDDHTLDIIKNFANRLYRWESDPDIGKVDAINRGLNYATGTIFNWLDPDDYLEPYSLFRCAKSFHENHLAAGWVGATRERDANGNVTGIIFPNGLEKENLVQNWNGGQFGQASCFLPTQKIKDCGGINLELPTFYGLDLWIRLLDRGDFIAGKGIWSSTVLTDSPNTENSEPSYLELSRLKAQYGFFPTDSGYSKKKLKEKHLIYTIPINLDDKLKKANDLYKRTPRIFEIPPKLTFISYSLPRFDKSSAEFRLYNILNLLLANNCNIDYIYCAKFHDDADYLSMFKGNTNFIYKPLNIQDYIRVIKHNSPDFVWISELWRIAYIEFMAELTQKLKTQFPKQKVIVDTVDFHFKEFYRKYELTKDQNDLSLANDYLKNEKILYQAADVVVVVSDDEKRDIQCKIKGIAKLEVVPNVHEIPDDYRAYSKRRNICFVGNFGTKHNFDAVQYFLDNIFHLILKTNPTVEFHVLGYLSEKHRKAFSRPNVKVIGSLKYLHKALTHYKLFVCPLTYGAGMKGKIGDAITAGIPVVTTSFGAEGLPVTDGAECFIADTPLEFANKCNQCLNDSVLWHNFSFKSRLMIAENFSPAGVARQLRTILSN